MNKPFIRIGSRHIAIDHIIGIDTNYEDDRFSQTVHIVLASLDIDGDDKDLASSSSVIDYLHGTPEAQAVIHWLESQSEVLL
jgi:hypothetical protein